MGDIHVYPSLSFHSHEFMRHTSDTVWPQNETYSYMLKKTAQLPITIAERLVVNDEYRVIKHRSLFRIC